MGLGLGMGMGDDVVCLARVDAGVCVPQQPPTGHVAWSRPRPAPIHPGSGSTVAGALDRRSALPSPCANSSPVAPNTLRPARLHGALGLDMCATAAWLPQTHTHRHRHRHRHSAPQPLRNATVQRYPPLVGPLARHRADPRHARTTAASWTRWKHPWPT